MSDYISKSALLKHLWDWRLQECPVGVCDEETETYKTICECIDAVKEQPTVDEKEIIRKPMERIVERMEDKRTEYEKISEQKYFDMPQACYYKGYEEGFKGAIKICKEEGGIE